MSLRTTLLLIIIFLIQVPNNYSKTPVFSIVTAAIVSIYIIPDLSGKIDTGFSEWLIDCLVSGGEINDSRFRTLLITESVPYH